MSCPHEHTYKQEWHCQLKPSVGDTDSIDPANSTQTLDESDEEDGYHPVKIGHPLVCHLKGSSCQSKLLWNAK